MKAFDLKPLVMEKSPIETMTLLDLVWNRYKWFYIFSFSWLKRSFTSWEDNCLRVGYDNLFRETRGHFGGGKTKENAWLKENNSATLLVRGMQVIQPSPWVLDLLKHAKSHKFQTYTCCSRREENVWKCFWWLFYSHKFLASVFYMTCMRVKIPNKLHKTWTYIY